MDELRSTILTSPSLLALTAALVVLVLSLAGPPWLRGLGRAEHDPSLRDKWKLFSWLHPVSAALLKWSVVLAVGVVVCVPAIAVARQHDVVAHAKQALDKAWHWK